MRPARWHLGELTSGLTELGEDGKPKKGRKKKTVGSRPISKTHVLKESSISKDLCARSEALYAIKEHDLRAKIERAKKAGRDRMRGATPGRTTGPRRPESAGNGSSFAVFASTHHKVYYRSFHAGATGCFTADCSEPGQGLPAHRISLRP
jgi:hypothetical protein